MNSGTVEKVDYTQGGAGNQWTTIDGKRYATWWDIMKIDWKVGDSVTFRPYRAPLWSGQSPIDCADQIRKAPKARAGLDNLWRREWPRRPRNEPTMGARLARCFRTARPRLLHEADDRQKADPRGSDGSAIPSASHRECCGNTTGERRLNVLDLFSGIGGFSLGLERAGMRTVAFCEIDPFARRVLAKHWPDVPCYDDVRTLTATRLRADGIAPDVICGGFPCQDISSAGNRAGIEGERSGLWSEYSRIIGELRPRYVIVENVARLLADGIGRVTGDLAALRYDTEWEVISGAAVGAPHLRERVWIIAYPQEGLRDRARVLSEGNGEGSQERFQRIRAVLSARRARHGPSADFGRLHKADGFSAGLDQIAALGNAVIPEIPEIIGGAIMNHTRTVVGEGKQP